MHKRIFGPHVGAGAESLYRSQWVVLAYWLTRTELLERSKFKFFCKQAATNSTYEAPGSLWVWNTWQQALLWLIACDALRVSACDAQLLGVINGKEAVLQRASVTTTSMSRRPKVQLLQLKLCMIDTCQRSWALATTIMEAVWAMIPVPFQVGDPVLRGTFGTRCREKEVSSIEVGSRGSERQHVTLCLINPEYHKEEEQWRVANLT